MALTQIELGMLKDGILTADTAGRLKMADGFVNSAKILDANVTASKLASGAAASNLGNYASSVDGGTGDITLANLSAFNRSLSPSGYQKLPGGMTIQWGCIYSTTDGSQTTVNFPISFSTAVRSIVGIQRGMNGGDQYRNGFVIIVGSENTSQFVVRQNSNGTNDWYWIAIGY